MLQENLIRMYEESFRTHRELPALTDYFKGETFSYYEMAKEIAKLHLFFKKAEIRRGDKIALVGRNNPRWCITYLATITYGAVIVPILQDFAPADIVHIVNHSESRLLFVGDNYWDIIEEDEIARIDAVLSLTDFHVIYERRGKSLGVYMRDMVKNYRAKYKRGFSADDIKYPDIPNDQMVLLNYTSGTTGYSKGVMLTVNNLTGNVLVAKNARNTQTGTHYFVRGGRTLSFLPLAHAYVTLLGKIPSPKILIEAMQMVKPTVICCVPLILEKIYRKQVLPLLEKGPMSIAMKIPLLNSAIYSAIRKKLIDSFGGEVVIFIVGGAPMNQETEAFLLKIKFPITVGYGMTECAPLISFTTDDLFKAGSCGMYIKEYLDLRIDSPDPEHTAGEIIVKGEHVMLGYYKNEKDTHAVLDPDGWLHTGDMGTVDPDGTLYIRGDRGQAQQHVPRAGIARAGTQRQTPRTGRARLRAGRARRGRQERPSADHGEQPQRVEYGRGRLRTCRSDHDLPHRIREDAQTQHQTLPLQRDAAGQITEKGRTAVKSAAGRPRRLIIHPPLVLSGFIRHIACRIFRRV